MMPTKIALLLALAVSASFVVDTGRDNAVAPQNLDVVEKYGVLGLLCVLCVGLLALVNKLSDAIKSNTQVSQDLVTYMKLIHQELQAGRTDVKDGREAAVATLRDELDRVRNDILDAVTRRKG